MNLLNIQKNVSKKIKDFRNEYNLTQENLAQKIQYTQKSITAWEKGTLPPLEVILKLKDVMNISLDEFLGIKPDSILKKYVIETIKNFEKLNISTTPAVLEKIVFEDVYKAVVVDHVENMIHVFEGSANTQVFNGLKKTDYVFFRFNGYVCLADNKYYVSPVFFKEAYWTCKKALEKEIKNPSTTHNVDNLKTLLAKMVDYGNKFKDLI